MQMAYGLTPVDLDGLVLWTDPGVYTKGFGSRRTSSRPGRFWRNDARCTPVHSMRFLRFDRCARKPPTGSPGEYVFVRYGYILSRSSADPVDPFAAWRPVLAPTFVPVPESEA